VGKENAVSVEPLRMTVSKRLEILAFCRNRLGRSVAALTKEIVQQPNVRIASFSGTGFSETRLYSFTSGKRGSM
jgi:hypothetical protein